MNLLKNFIVVLFVAIVLSACGGSSSPEAVVEKFQKAALNMDYETAKKYVTEDMYQALDQMAAMSSLATEEQLEMAKEASKDVEIAVKDSKISEDGETATVTIEVKKGGAVIDQSDVSLVKVNGEWKIKS